MLEMQIFFVTFMDKDLKTSRLGLRLYVADLRIWFECTRGTCLPVLCHNYDLMCIYNMFAEFDMYCDGVLSRFTTSNTTSKYTI